MTVEEFFDKVITVRMKEDRSALDIIDQTLLPGTIKRIRISTKEEIWEAIKKLKVRGRRPSEQRPPMESHCCPHASPRTGTKPFIRNLRN